MLGNHQDRPLQNNSDASPVDKGAGTQREEEKLGGLDPISEEEEPALYEGMAGPDDIDSLLN